MARMQPTEVAQLAAFITPAGSTVAEWVEKAKQESGYDPTVVNLSNHVGLWQIAASHYGEAGMPDASSKTDFIEKLKEPKNNWQAARALYAASGWRPWLASGGRPTPSREALEAAGAIDQGGRNNPLEAIPHTLGDLNPVDDVVDVIKQFVDPVLSVAKWLGDPNNWLRIVQVVGGITLGIAAATLLAKPQVEELVKR